MKIAPRQNLINPVLAILAAATMSGCGEKAAPPQPAVAPAATASPTNHPVPANALITAFASLQGKWLRPDGGYILEIRKVAPDGKMDAGYFNPRPINVVKAQASQENGSVTVFIELRDVNYPGSTYTLTYDPTSDRFKGDYFQAALKQTFDVVFTRVQP
jgi:hypothetical protein